MKEGRAMESTALIVPSIKVQLKDGRVINLIYTDSEHFNMICENQAMFYGETFDGFDEKGNDIEFRLGDVERII